MKHTLVIIGELGAKRAYLDVPLPEAMARYQEVEVEAPAPVQVIAFGDEFGVYDAWAL